MKERINNIFDKLKLKNNKGFAISTLIYGTIVLFIVVLSALILTMNTSVRLLEGKNNNVGGLAGNTGGTGDTLVTKITCQNSISLMVSESKEIECVVEPNNATDKSLSYSSGETSIASVNNTGIVIGKGIGETKVTVTANDSSGVSAEVSVIVRAQGSPNPPELLGLTPIKYKENDGWYITTEDDPEWYDYDSQKWANAAIVKNKNQTTKLNLPEIGYDVEQSIASSDVYAMFVWIPRFSYTIACDGTNCNGYTLNGSSSPGAIDIKFVGKNVTDTYTTGNRPSYTNGSTPSNWHTHPAFIFGGTNLSGIWVGKFETSIANVSAGSSSKPECFDAKGYWYIIDGYCDPTNVGVDPVILPNLPSAGRQRLNDQVAMAKEFTNSVYGLSTDVDAHVSKNSEWVSALYLAQSKYGKFGEDGNFMCRNSSEYYTGRSCESVSCSDETNMGYYTYDGKPTNACNWLPESVEHGTGASTTGNIYGVYDMYGGALERVMAHSGSVTGVDEKYYDYIPTTNDLTQTVNSSLVGQGLFETPWERWTTGTINFSTTSWLARGHYHNKYGKIWGVINVGNGHGDNGSSYFSFRTVLVNDK